MLDLRAEGQTGASVGLPDAWDRHGIGSRDMAFDIYGGNLRPGHCEVHPHVHEEFPCHVCVLERNRDQDMRADYDRQCAEEYEAYIARMIGDTEIGSWFGPDAA